MAISVLFGRLSERMVQDSRHGNPPPWLLQYYVQACFHHLPLTDQALEKYSHKYVYECAEMSFKFYRKDFVSIDFACELESWKYPTMIVTLIVGETSCRRSCGSSASIYRSLQCGWRRLQCSTATGFPLRKRKDSL